MAESENKKRPGEAQKSAVKPDAAGVMRDVSGQYGEEADIPMRQSRRSSAASKGDRPKKRAKTAAKGGRSSSGATKHSATVRRNRRKHKSLFEGMGLSGVKPLRLFGREFRFWPIVLLVFIFLLASGVILNNSNLNIVEQSVTIVGLPEELEGYRILVLSDLNAKRFGDMQSMLLRTVNAQKYDVLFCVGDMVGKSGNAEPFLEFLDGLRSPEKVYFVCGDADPGPFVSKVRDITAALPEMVLEDWILEAMHRGANYVDAPTCIPLKTTNLWVSPATLLNLETVSTLQAWEDQTAQEEDGVISGLAEDYATLPITSYRYQQAQRLYDAQRTMQSSEIHIALSHEVPDEDFIYTSQEHSAELERFLPMPELIVSGHYCGGVWRLPLIGPIYVPDRLLPRGGWFPDESRIRGLSEVGETEIYISAGLSNNGALPFMPFRLFNSPEIAILTLTSTLPENMLGNP